MKKEYTKPMAEKLMFDFKCNIAASSFIGHADQGIGWGQGGGCDHVPHHGNPHKPHP